MNQDVVTDGRSEAFSAIEYLAQLAIARLDKPHHDATALLGAIQAIAASYRP